MVQPRNVSPQEMAAQLEMGDAKRASILKGHEADIMALCHKLDSNHSGALEISELSRLASAQGDFHSGAQNDLLQRLLRRSSCMSFLAFAYYLADVAAKFDDPHSTITRLIQDFEKKHARMNWGESAGRVDLATFHA